MNCQEQIYPTQCTSVATVLFSKCPNAVLVLERWYRVVGFPDLARGLLLMAVRDRILGHYDLLGTSAPLGGKR